MGGDTKKKTRKKKIRNRLVSLVYLYICLFLFWRELGSSGSVAQAFDISYPRAQVKTRLASTISLPFLPVALVFHTFEKLLTLFFFFFSLPSNVVVA